MEESTYWLEEAPVFKAIKHMALPMIFAMAIGTIYNFTDTLFIGFLGDTSALAAVSLCLPYLAVVMALADLIGVGVGTAISRHLGMHDGETTKRLSSFALWGNARAFRGDGLRIPCLHRSASFPARRYRRCAPGNPNVFKRHRACRARFNAQPCVVPGSSRKSRFENRHVRHDGKLGA